VHARESTVQREDERELVEAPAERLEEEREEELSDEELAARSTAYFRVVESMTQILAGDTDVDLLMDTELLAEEEREALVRFQEAVNGRVGGRDLLAETRLAELGQALAILQPTLAVGLGLAAEAAVEQFHALVDRVDALRSELVDLTDAQEELFEQDKAKDERKPGDGDGDENEDEGDDDAKADEVDAPRVSTLTGEPAAVDEERPSTLAGGPGEPAVERPSPPSTVYDGDRGS
jgi:hypothetical protein